MASGGNYSPESTADVFNNSLYGASKLRHHCSEVRELLNGRDKSSTTPIAVPVHLLSSLLETADQAATMLLQDDVKDELLITREMLSLSHESRTKLAETAAQVQIQLDELNAYGQLVDERMCLRSDPQSSFSESPEFTSPQRHSGIESATSRHLPDISNHSRLSTCSLPSSSHSCCHYNRSCLVKFDCCEKYYPCHRCHNSMKTCKRNDLKASDAMSLKCLKCNRIQEVSHCCKNCQEMFAEYFCPVCKHLTSKYLEHQPPFHCKTCNICWNILSFCERCKMEMDDYILTQHVCLSENDRMAIVAYFEDAVNGMRRGCPICSKSTNMAGDAL